MQQIIHAGGAGKFLGGVEVYFYDPRLWMTLPGRFVVRVVASVLYVALATGAAVFLLSDIVSMRFFGIFLVLVLADRVVHLRQGDRTLSEFLKQADGAGATVSRVNAASYMRPKTFSLIESAFDKSFLREHDILLEVAYEVFFVGEVKEALRRLDVPVQEFKKKLEEFLEASGKDGSRNKRAVSKDDTLKLIRDVSREAFMCAVSEGHKFIEPSDVFLALARIQSDTLNRLFGIFEISADDMDKAFIFGRARRNGILSRLPWILGGLIPDSHRIIRHRIMNRAWTARPTPILDAHSLDFTDLAREGRIGFLIGHMDEYRHILDTIARPINPNALLMGESGVGKETLVRHLAFELIKDRVPPALFDKRLVSLEIGSLVSGASPEELNARLKKIIEEILVAGNIILYIPDIHNLVRTSGTAFISAADALLPIIRNNDFPVIGATYPREFKEFIERRSDFVGAFEVIRIDEMSESDAEKLLMYGSLVLERKFGIAVSFGAIKKAVSLARRYFHEKPLPSSAEELIKSALVEAQKSGMRMVGAAEIIKIAEGKTNIPLHEAGEDESKKLLNLEDIIHERIVDQEEAVRVVSESLREYRAGLSRKGGPIASFLFVGPTGVGKTELAKTLAKIQFGSEKQMIRFDMTEYQDKQSFFRFIGSPDGQVSGALTDAILERPYSLILLDEFEKAFPDILNLFLQVLDDGRLTDNFGRTVDFQNTIIIATSNAHSDIVNESLSKGESMADIAEYLKRKLVDIFKPELLNRFSKIVVFKNLVPADLERVVSLNLQELANTLQEKGITVTFDESVIKNFARIGYDPSFGARSLRRIIDEKLRTFLSRKILEHKIPRGSRLTVTMNGDEVDFTPAAD